MCDTDKEATERRSKSNVKLIYQLCTRIRSDLTLLQDLIDDVSSTIRCIDDECGVILDMTGRKMMRESTLGYMRLLRQDAVVDTLV